MSTTVKTWWIPALGLALLLVAVGGLVVMGGSGSSTSTQAAAPPADGGPPIPGEGPDPGLVDLALAAVSTDSATAPVLRRGPVRDDYVQSEPNYLGLLTLRAACAGNGKFTLKVRGLPGDVALAEVPVPCSAQPEATNTTFRTPGDYTLVEYALEGVEQASLGSGFAYRVTSSTGEPIIRGDDAGDPTVALDLSGQSGFGGSDSADPGEHGSFGKRLKLSGRYWLAAACTGTGVLRLKIRGTGQEFDVRCQWPPARQDFNLGELDQNVDVLYRYTDSSAEPTDFAFQLISR
ncbi:hypothetical protein [Actinoplanes sp. NPDC051851]|uniref:hypothetical protein n=1 Tax=Actinoplanes sp. NPDC051851 TaxID=3154753 RepID=UPI0034434DE7